MKKKVKSLFTWERYLLYFLVIAFVVTSCFFLLLGSMPIDEPTLRRTAPITFGNVLFLSLLFTIGDGLIRKFSLERPVKEILRATERFTEGDFNVRIPVRRHGERQNELDRIAEGFNKMADELKGVETLQTDFVANVSHELKTPLSVIQNYGTMLQQPDLTEEQRIEYGAAVSEASRRLAELITNILKLNRLENQQIFPEGSPYDLGEQLCETLLAYEQAWERKEIEIEADVADGVIVSADAELLNLVWSNLFSNAIKFTEPGGTVSVSLREDNGEAIVTVTDTGCGMTPETGAHIFEKFYQGDTSHAAQGNGLGLALVKRVIDIMGGSIFVKSHVGEGSTFTVRLHSGAKETEHG